MIMVEASARVAVPCALVWAWSRETLPTQALGSLIEPLPLQKLYLQYFAANSMPGSLVAAAMVGIIREGRGPMRQSAIWKYSPFKSLRPVDQRSFMMVTYSASMS